MAARIPGRAFSFDQNGKIAHRQHGRAIKQSREMVPVGEKTKRTDQIGLRVKSQFAVRALADLDEAQTDADGGKQHDKKNKTLTFPGAQKKGGKKRARSRNEAKKRNSCRGGNNRQGTPLWRVGQEAQCLCRNCAIRQSPQKPNRQRNELHRGKTARRNPEPEKPGLARCGRLVEPKEKADAQKRQGCEPDYRLGKKVRPGAAAQQNVDHDKSRQTCEQITEFHLWHRTGSDIWAVGRT
ncbi:MAG: hypothetical protein ABSA13_18765 [Beijerinckiaceae bacterium]